MAIAADCHSQMIIQGGKTWTPSPMFIYYNERLLENTVMQDSGAEIRDGMKAINRWGICSEDKCPYEISKFRVKPSRAAYADGAKHKIFNYARIGQSLLQLQSALANNDPFVFGFSVYESFESDQVAKTGIMPMPSQRENLLGGHAVLCCGFFNNTKTFLVRNSWGTDWGQQGYFHMPYDFILNENLAADFWSVKYVPS
jgi:C1A family cysteine protease